MLRADWKAGVHPTAEELYDRADELRAEAKRLLSSDPSSEDERWAGKFMVAAMEYVIRANFLRETGG